MPRSAAVNRLARALDKLHVLKVARGRHHLHQCTVERQWALMLREVDDVRLAQQLRFRPVGALWIGVTPANILRDSETGRSERVSERNALASARCGGTREVGNSWW